MGMAGGCPRVKRYRRNWLIGGGGGCWISWVERVEDGCSECKGCAKLEVRACQGHDGAKEIVMMIY